MNKQELHIIQLPLLFFHPSSWAWGANQHTYCLEIYPTVTVQLLIYSKIYSLSDEK